MESLLIDHPSIKDVSVVGIPDYLLGEKIKAYIITFSEEILTLQQIRKYLLDKSVVWHKLQIKLKSFPHLNIP
ncbi:AMP-binding enzyme [Providencia vermicola]|uniref:AMP-binding enzyme n=1 Tax=Providencia vermicola TaxID=333965 RepID=UPI0034DD0D5A